MLNLRLNIALVYSYKSKNSSFKVLKLLQSNLNAPGNKNLLRMYRLENESNRKQGKFMISSSQKGMLEFQGWDLGHLLGIHVLRQWKVETVKWVCREVLR